MHYYSLDTIKYSPYTAAVKTPNGAEHTCSFWTITYNIAGTCQQSTANVERTLDTTSILIIKPNEPHQILGYSDDYIQRDIYITDEEMRKICSFLPYNPYHKLLDSSPFFHVTRLNIEALEYLLNVFPVNSIQQDDYLSSFHRTVVANVLILFLETTIQKSTPPKWLTEFVKFISLPTNLTTNVSKLLSNLPYSHGHVCREFKKYYDCTLIAYIKKTRLSYSVTLLTEKTNSILDVALSVGFWTENAYIKAFKAEFGVSPGKWRKLNLTNKSRIITGQWGQVDQKKT